jgi:hypothetical protein
MSLGMGLAGTVVSAISFLTCWLRPVGPSHVKTVEEAAPEALSYFVLSSIIIAAAIVTYYVFFRHPFVKQHLQPQGETISLPFVTFPSTLAESLTNEYLLYQPALSCSRACICAVLFCKFCRRSWAEYGVLAQF